MNELEAENAFWIYYGKRAAAGEVIAGDVDDAERLRAAFLAGVEAEKSDAARKGGPG